MPRYIGVCSILLLIVLVAVRTASLRRHGILAMHFGSLDKTDFAIPPFAALYVYVICANAFRWPAIGGATLLNAVWPRWIGALLCVAALGMMIAGIVSFGRSFRVGIDAERPGKLVTSGVFAYTRNPLYLAFWLVLAGEFLILPTWLMLLYVVAGTALFHRQVLREEQYLRVHYGDEYEAYAARVPRYL